jgi:chemotaxis receptor (MCP) glutamine deamidase CheD
MHVGGEVGRKLIFNTETGVVMLKKLSNHSARAARH